jgi:anhydro-N-acetylmuramic acid kinase
MSGTSADGIDSVVAEVSRRGNQLRASVRRHVHRPFRAELRQRILAACLHGTVGEICELNFALGAEFAKAALAVIKACGLEPAQIRAIGSHGQTVHHLPNGRWPSTLQIGEPAVIAEQTGILTISNFRTRDMAAGGEGAPLVPYADWVLFADRKHPRIVQNIGGIGNLTWLPAGGNLDDLLAFDTGPGNMVIDAVVAAMTRGRQSFDRNGKLANEGKVSEKLLNWMMTHPFLRRPPPKTTGREEFGEAFLQPLLAQAKRQNLDLAEITATATMFTARSIAEAYRRFIFPRIPRRALPELEIILGGGGAYNPVLRRILNDEIGMGKLLTHEDFGIANAAKEALAFAILAYQTLHAQTGNVPAATGARKAVILGNVTPGRGGEWMLELRPANHF